MKGSSRWAHRQGKRSKAVAYGCYLPDDEPNPLDVERDAALVEQEAERERRKEAHVVLEGVKRASKGRAVLGGWEPDKRTGDH